MAKIDGYDSSNVRILRLNNHQTLLDTEKHFEIYLQRCTKLVRHQNIEWCSSRYSVREIITLKTNKNKNTPLTLLDVQKHQISFTTCK